MRIFDIYKEQGGTTSSKILHIAKKMSNGVYFSDIVIDNLVSLSEEDALFNYHVIRKFIFSGKKLFEVARKNLDYVKDLAEAIAEFYEENQEACNVSLTSCFIKCVKLLQKENVEVSKRLINVVEQVIYLFLSCELLPEYSKEAFDFVAQKIIMKKIYIEPEYCFETMKEYPAVFASIIKNQETRIEFIKNVGNGNIDITYDLEKNSGNFMKRILTQFNIGNVLPYLKGITHPFRKAMYGTSLSPRGEQRLLAAPFLPLIYDGDTNEIKIPKGKIGYAEIDFEINRFSDFFYIVVETENATNANFSVGIIPYDEQGNIINSSGYINNGEFNFGNFQYITRTENNSSIGMNTFLSGFPFQGVNNSMYGLNKKVERFKLFISRNMNDVNQETDSEEIIIKKIYVSDYFPGSDLSTSLNISILEEDKINSLITTGEYNNFIKAISGNDTLYRDYITDLANERPENINFNLIDMFDDEKWEKTKKAILEEMYPYSSYSTSNVNTNSILVLHLYFDKTRARTYYHNNYQRALEPNAIYNFYHLISMPEILKYSYDVTPFLRRMTSYGIIVVLYDKLAVRDTVKLNNSIFLTLFGMIYRNADYPSAQTDNTRFNLTVILITQAQEQNVDAWYYVLDLPLYFTNQCFKLASERYYSEYDSSVISYNGEALLKTTGCSSFGNCLSDFPQACIPYGKCITDKGTISCRTYGIDLNKITGSKISPEPRDIKKPICDLAYSCVMGFSGVKCSTDMSKCGIYSINNNTNRVIDYFEDGRNIGVSIKDSYGMFIAMELMKSFVANIYTQSTVSVFVDNSALASGLRKGVLKFFNNIYKAAKNLFYSIDNPQMFCDVFSRYKEYILSLQNSYNFDVAVIGFERDLTSLYRLKQQKEISDEAYYCGNFLRGNAKVALEILELSSKNRLRFPELIEYMYYYSFNKARQLEILASKTVDVDTINSFEMTLSNANDLYPKISEIHATNVYDGKMTIEPLKIVYEVFDSIKYDITDKAKVMFDYDLDTYYDFINIFNKKGLIVSFQDEVSNLKSVTVNANDGGGNLSSITCYLSNYNSKMLDYGFFGEQKDVSSAMFDLTRNKVKHIFIEFEGNNVNIKNIIIRDTSNQVIHPDRLEIRTFPGFNINATGFSEYKKILSSGNTDNVSYNNYVRHSLQKIHVDFVEEGKDAINMINKIYTKFENDTVDAHVFTASLRGEEEYASNLIKTPPAACVKSSLFEVLVREAGPVIEEFEFENNLITAGPSGKTTTLKYKINGAFETGKIECELLGISEVISFNPSNIVTLGNISVDLSGKPIESIFEAGLKVNFLNMSKEAKTSVRVVDGTKAPTIKASYIPKEITDNEVANLSFDITSTSQIKYVGIYNGDKRVPLEIQKESEEFGYISLDLGLEDIIIEENEITDYVSDKCNLFVQGCPLHTTTGRLVKIKIKEPVNDANKISIKRTDNPLTTESTFTPYVFESINSPFDLQPGRWMYNGEYIIIKPAVSDIGKQSVFVIDKLDENDIIVDWSGSIYPKNSFSTVGNSTTSTSVVLSSATNTKVTGNYYQKHANKTSVINSRISFMVITNDGVTISQTYTLAYKNPPPPPCTCNTKCNGYTAPCSYNCSGCVSYTICTTCGHSSSGKHSCSCNTKCDADICQINQDKPCTVKMFQCPGGDFVPPPPPPPPDCDCDDYIPCNCDKSYHCPFPDVPCNCDANPPLCTPDSPNCRSCNLGADEVVCNPQSPLVHR